MTIGDWLKLVGKSTDRFGAEIGVSGASVRRWRLGVCRPDWNTIARIEKATAGAVSASDFVPPLVTSEHRAPVAA